MSDPIESYTKTTKELLDAWKADMNREQGLRDRIAELEAELAALREALTSISTALDAYGVRWCRDVAKEALLQESDDE